MVRVVLALFKHSNLLLFPVDPISLPFDLSKATKLECAVFRPAGSLGVGWIAHALRVITSKHRDLRRISVDVDNFWASIGFSGDVRKDVGEKVFNQWLDLDRILVHLWESFSIPVNVRWEEEVQVGYVEALLPEMTRRGMVTADLVDRVPESQ